MTALLLAALVASPLPLSDLTAADLASRVDSDGALMDKAVRRAHWLIDASLTTPPPRSKADLADELTRLVTALDGAQAWWGGPASAEAGAQADKAYALHCVGRLALLSLLIAGADALQDAAPLLSEAAANPRLLHALGPLKKRWRTVRPGLRDRRDDRSRGIGWAIPYIERTSRQLAELRVRAVGRPLPSAEPTPGRLLAGTSRLAEWPAGSALPRHDVALSAKQARKIATKAQPGDVVLVTRIEYAGLHDGPTAAIVLGAWKDLDATYRRDRAVGKFLGERGAVNRKPSLYMRLRFPQVTEAWMALEGPAAVVIGGGGAMLAPLEDALRADSVQLLRARTTTPGRVRAVALAAHHVGRQMTSEEFVRGCYGPGDGMAGVGLAPLPKLSAAPAWELVDAKPAAP